MILQATVLCEAQVTFPPARSSLVRWRPESSSTTRTRCRGRRMCRRRVPNLRSPRSLRANRSRCALRVSPMSMTGQPGGVPAGVQRGAAPIQLPDAARRDPAHMAGRGQVGEQGKASRPAEQPALGGDIQPVSNAAITVALGPTLACTDDGAVCTENGRRLSNTISTVIQGPPGLSVATICWVLSAGPT